MNIHNDENWNRAILCLAIVLAMMIAEAFIK